VTDGLTGASTAEPEGPASGGPPGGGQRPAAAHSGPTADASSESAGTQSAPSAEDLAATGPEGSTAPAAESAGRFPPEEGRPDEQVAADADPLSQAQTERDEYREALIRLQADFENYKKRMIKQQTEHLERAAAALVDKLLPVLDTADLALAHGGGEDVKQITGSLTAALEKEGLERIAGEGAPFDPTLHDAVAHEPGDGDGEQTVVEVLRAGYRWKGRVLRPAMVKVRG
jgi:molecular chaperone GrpE